MFRKRYNSCFLLFSVLALAVILIQSCGGHGKIISFEFSTCKDTLDRYIHSLKNDSSIQIVDSTDNSGLNRPGYFDIIIKQNEKIHYYKMSYFGDVEYWKIHKESCELAIIAINNRIDDDFPLFSSEKNEAIKVFEKVIIPRLKDLPKCR